MSRLRRAVPVLILLSLGGCATMSESDCRYADWHRLGEQDALEGRTAQFFADRAQACHDHGYDADRVAWDEGWRRGLDRFCRPGSGYRHGLHGHDYSGTCPSRSERAFLAGYELGRDIHDGEQQLDRLEREIASLEDDREDAEEPEGKEARRLDWEIRDRRYEIRALERELGRLEAIAAERGFDPRGY